MGKGKYRIGDYVRVNSREWYDSLEKKHPGDVCVDHSFFTKKMSQYCDKIVQIVHEYGGQYEINSNKVKGLVWTDSMFACKVDMVPLKYKPGDVVVIKSIDWYNDNKDENGNVVLPYIDFTKSMSHFCGKAVTISSIHGYVYELEEDYINNYTDDMIDSSYDDDEEHYDCHYHKKKIFIDDVEYSDVVEISLGGNYELCLEGDKVFAKRKKIVYPDTYDKCRKNMKDAISGEKIDKYFRSQKEKMKKFTDLILCRDEYWRMANWKPNREDKYQEKYGLFAYCGKIVFDVTTCDLTFVFPTREMRDAFYNNFKNDLEYCIEFL